MKEMRTSREAFARGRTDRKMLFEKALLWVLLSLQHQGWMDRGSRTWLGGEGGNRGMKGKGGQGEAGGDSGEWRQDAGLLAYFLLAGREGSSDHVYTGRRAAQAAGDTS